MTGADAYLWHHALVVTESMGQPDPLTRAAAAQPLLDRWFAVHGRELPWRNHKEPWAILMSEIMLQQTPVNRVQPVFDQWWQRWPQPQLLAATSQAEVIKAWGRLGYPRRALRLHQCAIEITDRHAGQVPNSYQLLRELPGVGDYTAAAVLCFAFHQAIAVLDVNIRRVYSRWLHGQAFPTSHITKAERVLVDSLIPHDGDSCRRWHTNIMELGQLVCTAQNPDCARCPLAGECRWRSIGQPDAGSRTTKPQAYYGTDRYVRGLILAKLRQDDCASESALEQLWHDHLQLNRALESLIADGLVTIGNQVVQLPD